MTACEKRIFGGMARCPRGQRPPAEESARGPMRPWRTLAWLFLGGLRPRRAHLRFTKHSYYSASAGKKPGSHSGNKLCRNAVCIGSSLQEKNPRGRQGQSEIVNRLGFNVPSVSLIRRPTFARRSQKIIGVRPQRA